MLNYSATTIIEQCTKIWHMYIHWLYIIQFSQRKWANLVLKDILCIILLTLNGSQPPLDYMSEVFVQGDKGIHYITYLVSCDLPSKLDWGAVMDGETDKERMDMILCSVKAWVEPQCWWAFTWQQESIGRHFNHRRVNCCQLQKWRHDIRAQNVLELIPVATWKLTNT